MNWPFVSRAAHEAAIRGKDAVIAMQDALAVEYRIQLKAADERYAQLLEQFTALRVQGAVPEPKPALEPVAAPATPADELYALIDAKSGGNLRLRGLMLRQLELDRADGVDDDKIRESILHGIESSGVPA